MKNSPLRKEIDMPSSRATQRRNYKVFYPITTRWMDNDIYGHVNNVTYYSYFDSAVNLYLIKEGGLDIQSAAVVGYVVSSTCTFRKGVAYPDEIEAGLKVDKLGTSSVTYNVGIFKQGEDEACANGGLVHVFVDRAENKAAPIPAPIREALKRLLTE